MTTKFSKSKLLVVGGCLAIAGLLAFVAVTNETHSAKYYRVELETSPRPARFEELKFQLNPGVDVRAPASVDH